ncbi:MAG: hypothetical protein SF051_07975 [Elusimicrobiota bacterium]|nr:hypothetical protein [Elusimicrobiota bacterium]
MPPLNCPGCGAAGEGLICAYCGAQLVPHGDPAHELRALTRYHELVDAASKDETQCSRLISHGFVPASSPALVEAGMRCLAHLDPASPSSCRDQWLGRLDRVVARLKIIDEPAARRAAEEFAARVAQAKAQAESDTRAGVGCLIGLGTTLVVVAWFLLRRFF